MIIIDANSINLLKRNYGEPDMVCCYSKVKGVAATTQEAILLLNSQKVIILLISKLTNKLVQMIEFDKNELSDSILKSSFLFDNVWRFVGRKEKWTFRIQRKILPLGHMQKEFLDCLNSSEFI